MAQLNRWNSEPGAKYPTNPTVKSRPKFSVSTGTNPTSNNIAMEQTARRTNNLSDAVKGK